MRYASRTFLLLALSASMILLASCGQKSNCSGITFGGTGGGSNPGGLNNSGGTVCGSGSSNQGGSSGSDLVYYRGGSGGSNAINTGELTATTFKILAGVSAAVGNSTVGNMVIVNKKFLYLPDQNSSGGVMGFQINRSSGALTAIPNSPFAAPHAVTTIAADPDSKGGRYLYVADFTTGNFSTYTINPTSGALSLVSGSTIASTIAPSALYVDGTGSYIYGDGGTTTGELYGFSIDQNSGALSPIAGSPFSLGARDIQISPDGAWVLVNSGASSIDVIPIEAGTGTLLTASAVTYPTANPVGSISLNPNGNFLYTCTPKFPMEGYSFSGGALTALNGSPYTALSDMGDCQFDQSGTALFGIVTTTNAIGVRIINPSNGDVAGGIADLPVATNNFFAVTN